MYLKRCGFSQEGVKPHHTQMILLERLESALSAYQPLPARITFFYLCIYFTHAMHNHRLYVGIAALSAITNDFKVPTKD